MKRILAAVLLLVFTTTLRAQQPPNIVLIISDDQSYTDYSFMGHPAIETPHLDKLASESALFRRGTQRTSGGVVCSMRTSSRQIRA